MPQPKNSDQLAENASGALPCDRLSPVTENYLLGLYTLWEDSEEPTVTVLAGILKQFPATEGLGTSAPSVAGMVRRMQRQGLLEIGAGKRIRLTSQGLESGQNIVRRHRLAECLVVQILGMDLHRAHIEAHRLEHGMSDALQEKLMERLGQPKKSPFGRSIPGAGEPERPESALKLDAAVPDVAYVVERVPEEDSMILRFLEDSGIVPGREVIVVEGSERLGVMTVAVPEDKVSIGYHVARQILVRTVGST